MKFIIDRFEEGYAVCEVWDSDGPEYMRLPRSELPHDAREGDVIEKAPSGINILADETEERRRRINEKLERLFGSDN